MDTSPARAVVDHRGVRGPRRALALALSAQGAHLALNARNAAACDESARHLRGAPGAQVLGRSSGTSRGMLTAPCSRRAPAVAFGRLDALVNNGRHHHLSRFDAVSGLQRGRATAGGLSAAVT